MCAQRRRLARRWSLTRAKSPTEPACLPSIARSALTNKKRNHLMGCASRCAACESRVERGQLQTKPRNRKAKHEKKTTTTEMGRHVVRRVYRGRRAGGGQETQHPVHRVG